MVAASFVALFVWLAFILLVFSVLAAVGEAIDRAERRRERERVRAIRRRRDAAVPKRWVA